MAGTAYQKIAQDISHEMVRREEFNAFSAHWDQKWNSLEVGIRNLTDKLDASIKENQERYKPNYGLLISIVVLITIFVGMGATLANTINTANKEAAEKSDSYLLDRINAADDANIREHELLTLRMLRYEDSISSLEKELSYYKGLNNE